MGSIVPGQPRTDAPTITRRIWPSPAQPRWSGEPRLDRRRSFDELIAEIAERQRRVVGRWQLLGAGVPGHVIDRRIAAKRLFAVRRGVDALGHPSLRREDVTTTGGIPTTTVARTLLDRAAQATRAELRAELNQARHLGILDTTALHAQLHRRNGHAGAAVLEALVLLLPDRAASELEDVMLAVLRSAGLPEPEVNHPFRATGRSVRTDFRWRGPRFVLEVDGGEFHQDREADYARDLDLRLAGWDVQRATWRQVQDDPDRVVAGVRLALEGGPRCAGRARPLEAADERARGQHLRGREPAGRGQRTAQPSRPPPPRQPVPADVGIPARHRPPVAPAPSPG